MFVKGIPNSTHTSTAYALPKVLPLLTYIAGPKEKKHYIFTSKFLYWGASKVFFLGGGSFGDGPIKMTHCHPKKKRKENLGGTPSPSNSHKEQEVVPITILTSYYIAKTTKVCKQ